MLKVRVLEVNGNNVRVSDGTRELVTTRSLLDSKVKEGTVYIDNIKVTCIEKIRNKHNIILNYKVMDRAGNIRIVDPKVLKSKIYSYEVECINLYLTSDGKLKDKDIKTPETMPPTPETMTLTPEPITQTPEANSEIQVIPVDVNEHISLSINDIKSPIIHIVSSTEYNVSNISLNIKPGVKIEKLIVFGSVTSIKIHIKESTVKEIIVEKSLSIDFNDSEYCTNIEAGTIKCDLITSFKNIPKGTMNMKCKNFYIEYSYNSHEVEDGKIINVTVFDKIKGNPSIVELLVNSGNLVFYTNHGTDAFDTLINSGVKSEVLNKDVSSQFKAMQNRNYKEKMLGNNYLDSIATKFIDQLDKLGKSHNSQYISIDKLGLNVDIPDIVFDTYYRGREVEKQCDKVDKYIYNIIDTLIKITTCNIKPFTTAFLKVLDDVNFGYDLKTLTILDEISIEILGIRYLGYEVIDYYLIVRNGIKLIHMALIDNISIDDISIVRGNVPVVPYDLDEVYGIFDKFTGINENGNIKHSISTNKMSDNIEKDFLCHMYALVNTSGIYVNNSNIKIIKLNNGYALFKYNRTKSSYGPIIFGTPIRVFNCRGFDYVSKYDIDKIFNDIRGRMDRVYEKSATNYIISYVLSQISDELKSNTLKPQRVSNIWVVGKEHGDKIIHDPNESTVHSDALNNFTMEEFGDILDLDLFTIINESNYFSIKNPTDKRSYHGIDFEVIEESCNTKAKFIGQFNYEARSRFKIIDSMGDVTYAISSLSLSKILKIISNIGKNSNGMLNFDDVYTMLSLQDSKYMELYSKEIGVLDIHPKVIKSVEYLSKRYCTVLFETGIWYRSGIRSYNKTKYFRKIQIVIDNKTGLLYTVLNSFGSGSVFRTRGDGKNYVNICERVFFRIPDTKSAMLLIKKLNTEAASRRTIELIHDMCEYDDDYTYGIFDLQRQNESDINKYKEKLGNVLYERYKAYLAYWDGEYLIEESDQPVNIYDTEEIVLGDDDFEITDEDIGYFEI